MKKEKVERPMKSMLDNLKQLQMCLNQLSGDQLLSLTNQYGLLELVRLLLQNKQKKLSLILENGWLIMFLMRLLVPQEFFMEAQSTQVTVVN